MKFDFVLQAIKTFSPERSKGIKIVFHISDNQLLHLLSVLLRRQWKYKLHTIIYDTQDKTSSTFPQDSDFWVVCWKAEDGKVDFDFVENEKDIR